VASGINPKKVVDLLIIFSGSVRIEGVHPLQFGFFRRKLRAQRRYGLPVLNPIVFYPWRALDFVRTAARWFALVRRYRRILADVMADPASHTYADEALRAHAGQDEADHFIEMFADKIPATHGAPARLASSLAAASLLRVRAGGGVGADLALGAAQQSPDIGAVHDP